MNPVNDYGQMVDPTLLDPSQLDPSQMPMDPSGYAGMGRGMRRGGGRKSDCAWCQFGKPAALGALLGVGFSFFTGSDVGRGVLWGAGAGALYGAVKG